MNEADARAWLVDTLAVSRETLDRLGAYACYVAEEQRSQNLVSAATLPDFWARHIVDSAQLIRLAKPGTWLDIGSGAGLPGIVVAILTGQPVHLVEPRARRAVFLVDTVERLQLTNIRITATTLQKLDPEPTNIIAARAVASLVDLITMAHRFASPGTIWLLPKGKSAKTELASLPSTWHGEWEMHDSVTDPDSQILVGRNIRVI